MDLSLIDARYLAGVFRFSGPSLAVDPYHEPDRIDIGHGAAAHGQDPGGVSRETILGLTFKLGQSAAKRWRRLRGYQWFERLDQGATFIDDVEHTEQFNTSRSAT